MFDYCKANDKTTINDWYKFVTDVANSFLDSYTPIVKKRKDMPYGEKNAIGKKFEEDDMSNLI